MPISVKNTDTQIILSFQRGLTNHNYIIDDLRKSEHIPNNSTGLSKKPLIELFKAIILLASSCNDSVTAATVEACEFIK